MQILIITIVLIFCIIVQVSSFPVGGQPYLPQWQHKRQAPNFGPNAIVTKANCDETQSGAGRRIYQCYDGQSGHDQGHPDLSAILQSSNYQVIPANCDTTEDSVDQEHGTPIHKIVYMCHEGSQQRVARTITDSFSSDESAQQKRGPAYLPQR